MTKQAGSKEEATRIDWGTTKRSLFFSLKSARERQNWLRDWVSSTSR